VTDDLDLRAQLAAYLAGELEADAADRLEARMAGEPWVAGAADDVAALLLDLGRVDEAAIPEGAAARVRAGVAARLGVDLPAAGADVAAAPGVVRRGPAAGPAGSAPAGARPAGRPGAGRRPGDRRARRLHPGLAVVGALVALGLAGVGLVAGGGGEESAQEVAGLVTAAEADAAGGDGDTAREADVPAGSRLDAATGDVAADGEETESGGGEEATSLSAQASTEEEEALESAAATDAAAATGAAAAAPAPPGRPAVLVLGPSTADDAADLVAGLPAVQDLLGADAATAPELAAAYRDELLRADAVDGGLPPGTCVVDVLEEGGDGVVPAAAADAEVDGEPLRLIALVRSVDGAALDRVEVWLVDPGTCAVRSVVTPAPE
jgi:hypothetical protein